MDLGLGLGLNDFEWTLLSKIWWLLRRAYKVAFHE